MWIGLKFLNGKATEQSNDCARFEDLAALIKKVFVPLRQATPCDVRNLYTLHGGIMFFVLQQWWPLNYCNPVCHSCPIPSIKVLLSIYHQRVLLLFAEHRASMKSFQALRSPPILLTSFHDLSMFLISSCIVLRHVLFGLLLPLYPWGFQSNAVFSIDPASLHNVCPIQLHFLLSIWISIGFCLVIFHSSSFVILSVHFIFVIRLKYLCKNVCNLLVWFVVFQVSQLEQFV